MTNINTVEPPGMHIMNDLSLSSDDHVPIGVPGVSPNGAGSTCTAHAPSVSFAYFVHQSPQRDLQGGGGKGGANVTHVQYELCTAL